MNTGSFMKYTDGNGSASIQDYDILNHAFDAITINDSEGRLIFANDAYENLCGINLKPYLHTHCEDFVKKKIISKSVAAEALRTKKRTFDISRFPITGKTALVISTPILDENNQLVRIITNVRESQELTLNPKEELIFDRPDTHPSGASSRTSAPIHSSIQMQEIISRVHHVVDLNMNILITGETGTGKGVLAQYIHQLSQRREFPFVKINCAAFPENLIESELFGYESGAFTGAEKGGKQGLLNAAHQGILFLDEIGDMPYHLQAKLLDFLQHGEFMRIGSTQTTKVDVQIIAATNQDLPKMIEEKKFRKDLYYRLNVIPLRIPPLRERREEIPLFISHFMESNIDRFHKKMTLTPEVIDTICSLPLSGNVRELEHLIQALFVLSNDETITMNTLSQIMDVDETGKSALASDRDNDQSAHHSAPAVSAAPQIDIVEGMTFKELVSRYELELINRYIERYGSVKKAAAALSVHPSLIWRKLQNNAGQDKTT